MSLITESLLVRSKADPAGAKLYAAPLAAACDRRGIVSIPAVRCFLANVLNESAAMTRAVEDTYYSDAAYLYSVFRSHLTSQADAAKYTRNSAALAAKIYGNMQGRGLMETTGLANYTAYAAAVGKTLAEIGAYMETPEGAADSAAWVFVHNGCLPFADKGDLINVTRRIEGGQNPIGWVSVQKWHAQVTQAFGSPVAATLHAGASTLPAHPALTKPAPVVTHKTTNPSAQAGLSITREPQPTTDDLNDAQLASIKGA